MERLICGASASARPRWRCARLSRLRSTASRLPSWFRDHQLNWARQHNPGLLPDRFRGFPRKCRPASRLIRPRRSTGQKEGLAEEGLDIVVGNPRLLRQVNSSSFATLGLLIVDEEQHFLGFSQPKGGARNNSSAPSARCER